MGEPKLLNNPSMGTLGVFLAAEGITPMMV